MVQASGDEFVYRLVGVSRCFRRGGEEVVALRDVDLDVARGQLLMVMGPSGSGKSTLLHLLGGLDRPSAGRVEFRADASGSSVDLAALGEEPLAAIRRRQIGFVFQEFHLLPTLTATENTLLPLLLDGRTDGSARERAITRLRSFGLGARLDHLPDQLSGGERQRVALARALVADPPVVLCDEPTGSLDSERGREIFGLLRELARAEGRTVVVVTHDPAALPFADRLLTLRDGALDGGAAGEEPA